jgi:DNA polymerase I-like protein with 3'-5' exonuclease and polymerase domains
VTRQHPSTSEEALLALTGAHPLPGIILEHRHLLKLLRAYIDPFVAHATTKARGTA